MGRLDDHESGGTGAFILEELRRGFECEAGEEPELLG